MSERAIDVRGSSLEESRAVMAAVLRMRLRGVAASTDASHNEAGIRRWPQAAESPAESKPHPTR